MMRLMLKTMVPLLAAVLLDQYCARRVQRQRAERAADLARWEGEGGAATPAASTAAPF